MSWGRNFRHIVFTRYVDNAYGGEIDTMQIDFANSGVVVESKDNEWANFGLVTVWRDEVEVKFQNKKIKITSTDDFKSKFATLFTEANRKFLGENLFQTLTRVYAVLK